jgi:hypothetical protein
MTSPKSTKSRRNLSQFRSKPQSRDSPKKERTILMLKERRTRKKTNDSTNFLIST